MEYTKAVRVANPCLAADVANLLATVVLAGVRIAPSPRGHTLTLRNRTEQCPDIRTARDVLRRWGGQA